MEGRTFWGMAGEKRMGDFSLSHPSFILYPLSHRRAGFTLDENVQEALRMRAGALDTRWALHILPEDHVLLVKA